MTDTKKFNGDPKLGTKISRRIEDLGWTQRQLAEAVGVATSTVCKWVSGRTNISYKHLEKVAHTLGVEPSAFTDSSPREKQYSGEYMKVCYAEREIVILLRQYGINPQLALEFLRMVLKFFCKKGIIYSRRSVENEP